MASVTINSPDSGAHLYNNVDLTVSWSYSGTEEYRRGDILTTGSVVLARSAAGQMSATIPANTLQRYYPPSGNSQRITVQVIGVNGLLLATGYVDVYFTYAPPPSAPEITSPVQDSTHSVTSAITVSWEYQGTLPQSWADVSARPEDRTSYSWVGSAYDDDTSKTLPGNALRAYLTPGQRNSRIYLQVETYDKKGRSDSDNVGIYVTATYPDKPVPTAPVNGAQTYPTALTTFTAPYEDHGGIALAQTAIEWYKDGETEWSRYQTFNDSSETHTLPAGTFDVGKWYWRMRHKNALGEVSEWSDRRTLYSVDGIAITSPGEGEKILTPQEITVEWNAEDLSGYTYDGFAVVAWTGSQWAKMAQVDRNTSEAVIPAATMDQYYGGNAEYAGGTLGVAATDSGTILEKTVSHIQILTRQAHAPQKPVITSPAAGSQHYVNGPIDVSWTYRGELPQKTAIIYVSVNGSGLPWQKIATVSGTGTSHTIPADALRQYLTPDVRATGLWVRVDAYDTAAQWASDSLLFYILATYPDKPIPTAPADGAQTYPAARTAFSAPYEDHGGLALAQTVIEWYKDGDTEWNHYKTFDGGDETHELPAGTFALGTWHWRMRHKNALGESGPWSDAHTLYSVSSAPMRPTLTQPANGETVYSSAPVVFGWTYYGSGVTQGGYTLRYNVADSGWVTVTGAGADTTRAVDLEDQTGSIQWQVQVRNAFGETSAWSAIGTFYLASSVPTATPTYPTGGFIDRHESQAFTWDYSSPIDSAQTGYQISWAVSGTEDWTTVAGSGSAPYHVFAADYFPEAQAIIWRLLVYDGAGQSSNFTADFTFSTKDVAPDAPTPLEPIGLYLSPDQDATFTWRHNSSLGTPQGAAEIQWRLNGGEWKTVKATGSSQTTSIKNGTFSAGTVSWQVRTANRDGEWGPWSQTVTFGITGAPGAPIITQTYGTSRPGIDWLAQGQVVYQIEFTDADGALIYSDTRLAIGDAGSYRIPRYLTPGLVRIRLRVKNQYDAWSPWASTQIQVAADGLTPPGISAYGDNRAGVIRVSVDGVDWATATRVILYRDGEPIASLSGGEYMDAACAAGSHVYSALAEYAGTRIARSAEVWAVLKLYDIALAPMDAPGDILWIRHGLDSPPERAATLTPETAQPSVAGRTLPMAFYGEHMQRAYAISCAMDAQEVRRLTALMGARVIYRDPDGRADVCQITTVQGQAIPFAPGRRQVSIALDAVDVAAFSIF